MKKILIGLGLLAGVGVLYTSNANAEEVGLDNYLLRAYNPNSGEHFFTTSYAEADWLTSQGWIQEGQSFLSDVKDEVPVYRSYNKNTTTAGAHMFTTDKSEQDGLVAAGWINEDIQFYAKSAYSRLETRISYCDQNVNEADYTASAYEEFKSTLDSVKSILNNTNSTAEELQKASEDLYNALEKLHDSNNVDE